MREYETNPGLQWEKPNLEWEFGEIDRTAKEFSQGDKEKYGSIMWGFKNQFENAQLEPLTDEVWSKLENTDSYNSVAPGDIEGAGKIAESNKRSWKQKLNSMRNGKPMPAPIIFEMNGRYHKVSGNTRLMLARALNSRPRVIFIRYKE